MSPVVQKRGGARPGAGRKPLSETVKKIDPEIINAGILPLEMRLRVARHMWAAATELKDGAVVIKDLAKAKEAADFAEAALPYTSNRLATMIHTGPTGGPVEHKHTVVDEVSAMIAEEAKNVGKRPATRH